jgi:holliday junction DNA helicase RuvB
MARQRVIDGDAGPDREEQSNWALRPRQLAECIGQRNVIAQLRIALDAAKKRG